MMDRYTETIDRVSKLIDVLRELGVPPETVHSIDVQHWADGATVGVHVNGSGTKFREVVDRIGDHYDLPPDDGRTTNYARGRHLGRTPVFVFCGR